jgi:hypothetical protein
VTDATGETHRLGEWVADHARIYTDIIHPDDPSRLQGAGTSGGFTIFM